MNFAYFLVAKNTSLISPNDRHFKANFNKTCVVGKMKNSTRKAQPEAYTHS